MCVLLSNVNLSQKNEWGVIVEKHENSDNFANILQYKILQGNSVTNL